MCVCPWGLPLAKRQDTKQSTELHEHETIRARAWETPFNRTEQNPCALNQQDTTSISNPSWSPQILRCVNPHGLLFLLLFLRLFSCFLFHAQGPPDRGEGSRFGLVRPDFVLFWICPFLSFLGLSQFLWDFPHFVGDFPDLSFLQTPARNILERVRDTIRTFPEKLGNHPIWKPMVWDLILVKNASRCPQGIASGNSSDEGCTVPPDPSEKLPLRNASKWSNKQSNKGQRSASNAPVGKTYHCSRNCLQAKKRLRELFEFL